MRIDLYYFGIALGWGSDLEVYVCYTPHKILLHENNISNPCRNVYAISFGFGGAALGKVGSPEKPPPLILFILGAEPCICSDVC
jgi:hypothetical protein